MGDKITYEELEEKVRKRLEYALNHGHNDDFVHARNLSTTLINLNRAKNEMNKDEKVPFKRS